MELVGLVDYGTPRFDGDGRVVVPLREARDVAAVSGQLSLYPQITPSLTTCVFELVLPLQRAFKQRGLEGQTELSLGFVLDDDSIRSVTVLAQTHLHQTSAAYEHLARAVPVTVGASCKVSGRSVELRTLTVSASRKGVGGSIQWTTHLGDPVALPDAGPAAQLLDYVEDALRSNFAISTEKRSIR